MKGDRLTQLQPFDLRIPQWDRRHLLVRRCPFCSSAGTPRYRRPDGLTIRYCRRCGTFFISPAPGSRTLDRFYARYFAAHRKAELDLHRGDRLLVREMRALDPLSDEKFAALERLRTLRGLNVLDVGFGMGQSLLFLQSLGTFVTGIDPDPDAVGFARSVLGIAGVERSGLSTYRSPAPFDVILMHDLIEHPLRPLDLLRKARTLLAPGGLISVWTPNASRALSEDEPLLFRLDLEHMQYLTVDTCRYIARRLSLDIVHCAETGHPRLERTSVLDGRAAFPRSVKSAFRRALAFLPGVERLTNLRRAKRLSQPSTGSYHLFCVFRRPS